MNTYVFPAAQQDSVAIQGLEARFAVRRVICVGRNYADHAREMGKDPDKEPPFFFTKPADAVVESGATIPYPPETKNLHYEMELVLAIGREGANIPPERAFDYVWGYCCGIDLTRRDLQLAARKKERPWEVGKSFDHSAPCGALQPASKIGHPAKGKIWLSVNGAERQKGDLTELIWSVPEIIAKLSEQVSLGAGDIIMTGTPAGVAALSPGDNIECGVDGIGTLKVAIGKPE